MEDIVISVDTIVSIVVGSLIIVGAVFYALKQGVLSYRLEKNYKERDCELRLLREERNKLLRQKYELMDERDACVGEAGNLRQVRSNLSQRISTLSDTNTSYQREIVQLKNAVEKYRDETVAHNKKYDELNAQHLDLQKKLMVLQAAANNSPSSSPSNNHVQLTKVDNAKAPIKDALSYSPTAGSNNAIKVDKNPGTTATPVAPPVPNPQDTGQCTEISAPKGRTNHVFTSEKLEQIRRTQQEVMEEMGIKELNKEKRQGNTQFPKITTKQAPLSHQQQTVMVRATPSPFCESAVLSGNAYHCLLWYVPKGVENDSIYVQRNRQAVYDFKDGHNSAQAAEWIANALRSHFSSHDLNTGVFAVIPASTYRKNELRYKDFCHHISDRTGLINGFDSIQVREDRASMKGQKHVDKTANLRYNSASFSGKTVFLFDDVITTGTSFLQNAKELQKRGARKVIGIFLARTKRNNIVTPEN